MDDESLVRRYLLGLLPEEQRRAVEERYFENSDYFDQVSAIEGELIDDYVNGELSREDRRQFERECLRTPAIRERVDFARSLQSSASGRTPVAAMFTWPRLAFALLALIGLLTFLRFPASNPTPIPTPQVFAIVLAPGGVRSEGQVQRYAIPAAAEEVRVSLVFENRTAYRSFRAVLRTVEGARVWAGPVEDGPNGLQFRVQHSVLKPDDYVLTLWGTDAGGQEDEVADYSLRIL